MLAEMNVLQTTAEIQVSGSPLPDGGNLVRYSGLPRAQMDAAGTFALAGGDVHHCCWPCICDAQTHLKVDTKTVETATGPHTFEFLVIGDPCVHGPLPMYLARQAPDVTCGADGHLDAATFSDGGYVVVGLLQSHDSSTTGNATSSVANSATFDTRCAQRAAMGTTSGMGKIFIDVASINPIEN